MAAAAPPTRPTGVRPGRVALAGGAVLVLLAALAFTLLRREAAPYLPGGQSCTAGRGDPAVRLSPDTAVAASRAVAGVVRDRAGLDAATSAVRRAGVDREDAVTVARALTGRDRGAFTCSWDADVAAGRARLDTSGLTARAAAVRADLDRAFGRQKVGGFAPGGVRTGHQPGSAHYEGRAVDVFFRPVSDANKQRGWAVASYLVAHADRLDVATVIFDDRIWTTRRSGEGWRAYDIDTSGRPARTAAILEHRDHVHVDVFG